MRISSVSDPVMGCLKSEGLRVRLTSDKVSSRVLGQSLRVESSLEMLLIKLKMKWNWVNSPCSSMGWIKRATYESQGKLEDTVKTRGEASQRSLQNTISIERSRRHFLAHSANMMKCGEDVRIRHRTQGYRHQSMYNKKCCISTCPGTA